MSNNNTSYFASVDDVKVLDVRGPWPTKSGGELNVLFSLSYAEVIQKFLHYDEQELAKIPKDIRGLRSYRVSHIPHGTVGANEWHKVRQELVFAINGSVRWTCKDLEGRSKEFVLDGNKAVWVPPYILHTYEAQDVDTSLIVIANTLFFIDEPSSQDTYSAEEFDRLIKTS